MMGPFSGSKLARLFMDSERKAPLYQPLVEQEIRLLSVLNHTCQHLVCRLDTHHHRLAPEFDELSYCWGGVDGNYNHRLQQEEASDSNQS